MKKLKSLKFNIFLPIVWGLIAVMVVLFVSDMVIAAMSVTPLSNEASPAQYANLADEWLTTLNAKGTQGLLDDQDFQSSIERLPEGVNAVLLDRDNKIVYAANKTYIQDTDRVNLLISPYQAERVDWEYQSSYTGGTYQQYANTRLALLIDDAGEVIAPLCAVFSEDMSDIGAKSPKYREYFPMIDEAYYQDAVYDTTENAYEGSAYSWSYLDPPITIEPLWDEDEEITDSIDGYASPSDQAMALKVRDYVQWENAQISRAGDMRVVYRGPAWDGSQLIVLYQGGDEVYASEIRWHQAQSIRNILLICLGWCIPLLIIALAGWVYMDANKRNFRPAFWGILTLIGNGITWIVYMIVRPNGRLAKGCPGCHAPIRGGYAYCPVCGTALRAKCATCAHVLEPSWHYCPDCGQSIGDTRLEPILRATDEQIQAQQHGADQP